MADEKIIHEQLEETKRQMDETRASLAAKLDTLETKVGETVREATDAVSTVKETVQSTVETVKDTVEETVCGIRESVHDTVAKVGDFFDVNAHFASHPWLMLGGAVAVGFASGCLLHPSSEREAEAPTAKPQNQSNGHGNGSHHRTSARRHEHRPPAPKGFFQNLVAQVEPEIDKLKNMAVGTLASVVHDWISPKIPESIKPQFNEMMDDITQKLTGNPKSEPEFSGKSKPLSAESRRFVG